MTTVLKKFIWENMSLIESNDFEELFMRAYNKYLLTSEVRELHTMLLDANIVDSSGIRNMLLYDTIDKHLDDAAADRKTRGPALNNLYLAHFLRYYLNNAFGFTEAEAMEFVRDNQKQFRIKLTPVDSNHAFINYEIEFNR